MELKGYQRAVLEDLEGYLAALSRADGLQAAWREYWAWKGAAAERGYRDALGRVPNVCVKVPTGGGKTFLAACALRKVFDWLPPGKARLVLWLVPSDAILEQTLKNLGNPGHPYRRRLERDFAGRVNVLGKEQMLAGQEFRPADVEENLTVGVLCYASVRVSPRKAEDRKIYQENPGLDGFASWGRDEGDLLEGTPGTALIQAVRRLNPVVVVDESHKAGSELSAAMLRNLNPAFVLSLTATPREEENVVSRVDARALKREHMVKLPVIVYRRGSRGEVFRDALKLRAALEAKARAERKGGGAYIRPIVLFQAQPRTGEEAATFDKIRARLVAAGVPEAEIAVKTAQKDELKGVDLMSEGCPVRYVVTVNALKEGWDCPFAYVLASLANKTSRTDVEQVLGRILRQPFAMDHGDALLNMSYVLSCGADFQATIDSVVAGLNGAGFSRMDYREAEDGESQAGAGETGQTTMEWSADGNVIREGAAGEASMDAEEGGGEEDFGDLSGDGEEDVEGGVEALVESAVARGREYGMENGGADGGGTEECGMGGAKWRRVNGEFAESAARLKVPQFAVRADLGIFGGGAGGEWVALGEGDLTKGFSLGAQDATLAFSAAMDDIAKVDLAEQGDAAPKSRMLSKWELEVFTRQLAGASDEAWLGKMAGTVAQLLDRRIDACSKEEIRDYVRRGLAALPEGTRRGLGPEMVVPFAESVKDKIEGLMREYRRAEFVRRLDANEIQCVPMWTPPAGIAPDPALEHVEKSLYEAEWGGLNGAEMEIARRMAAADSVLWWHRIRERQGFCINGWRRHYPDFMVMTRKGTIVLVEVKGPQLVGRDSGEKCGMGRKWADMAGVGYKYFMVFPQGVEGVPGAVESVKFLDALERL